jgi:hypothetical protein
MSSTAIELVKIEEGRLVVGAEFSLALENLKKLCQGLTVTDRDTCEQARHLVKQSSDTVKAIFAAAEPERIRLRAALDELLGQRDRMAAQFTSVTDWLDKEARKWAIQEQEAAKAEQDRLNKGKRAEQRVEVKPNVPTVPGTRLVIKYRCDVLDVSKVKREWMTPDIQAIQAEARKDQDPAKTEKKVGGVRIRKE